MAKHYSETQKQKIMQTYVKLKSSGLSGTEASKKIKGPHHYTITDWIKKSGDEPAEVEIVAQSPAKRAYKRVRPPVKPAGKLAVIIGSPKDVAAALIEMGV